MVHVHVRDESGAPTHRRDLYERTIGMIREKVPELVVCVTTGSRVDPDLSARMVGLELEGTLRPDMASLTLGSFNFPRSVNANPPAAITALLERMSELGIRPEFEVFELGMVNTLHALSERGLVPDPPVVNILLGSMGAAPAFVGDLAVIVSRLPEGRRVGRRRHRRLPAFHDHRRCGHGRQREEPASRTIQRGTASRAGATPTPSGWPWPSPGWWGGRWRRRPKRGRASGWRRCRSARQRRDGAGSEAVDRLRVPVPVRGRGGRDDLAPGGGDRAARGQPGGDPVGAWSSDLGAPVVTPDQLETGHLDQPVVVPLLTPGFRWSVEAEARALGLHSFPELVDPTATVARTRRSPRAARSTSAW